MRVCKTSSGENSSRVEPNLASTTEVFIPSLTPPDQVLLPYLNWRNLNQFRYRSALEVAVAWVKMRPFTPEAFTTDLLPRSGRTTFGVTKSEGRLPLLFQLLGILHRIHDDAGVASLCNSIAPTTRNFCELADDAAGEPKWDDIDGSRRYPLRSFLLCAVTRNIASLGSGVRIVVPEPRFAECKELLFELYRLQSVGGPSIEIADLGKEGRAELWEYIPDVKARPYTENPGSFHSEVIVGFGIAAPTIVYRHVLAMTRSAERDRPRGPGSGFSALSAIRLLPRWNRHRLRILGTLAEVAYANLPPDFRALVCYEVALQLCHERTSQSLVEASGWLTKGFKALSAVTDEKQKVWEIRLRNCDAYLSYVSGNKENALRKLGATLRDITTGSTCDETLRSWASAIVMTNIARILQQTVDTLAQAVESWREVERLGNGSQQEHALGEQVKAHVKLGRLDEAMAKAGKYCNRRGYMSVHLDWELALRTVYCLAALRTRSPGRPTEQDVSRIAELEWWCGGGLVA